MTLTEWVKRLRHPDDGLLIPDSPLNTRHEATWLPTPASRAPAASTTFAHASRSSNHCRTRKMSSSTRPHHQPQRSTSSFRIDTDVAALRRSRDIDKQLKVDGLRDKKERGKERTMLLLGQEAGGKTTVFKQMRMLYKPQGFEGERETWRVIVLLNVMQAVRLLLQAYEDWLLVEAEQVAAQQQQQQQAAATSPGVGSSKASREQQRPKTSFGMNAPAWNSSGDETTPTSQRTRKTPAMARIMVRSDWAHLERLRASTSRLLDLEGPLRKTLGAFGTNEDGAAPTVSPTAAAAAAPPPSPYDTDDDHHATRPWLDRPTSADSTLLLRAGWQERLLLAKKASSSSGLSGGEGPPLSNASAIEAVQTPTPPYSPTSSLVIPSLSHSSGSPLRSTHRLPSTDCEDATTAAAHCEGGGGESGVPIDYEALACKVLETVAADIIALWRRPFAKQIRTSGGRFDCYARVPARINHKATGNSISSCGSSIGSANLNIYPPNTPGSVPPSPITPSIPAAHHHRDATLYSSSSSSSSNSVYFLDCLPRIASPLYVPSDADILQARMRTFGVHEETFPLPATGLRYRVIDVGGARNQRPAWSHLFSGPGRGSGEHQEDGRSTSQGHGRTSGGGGAGGGPSLTLHRPLTNNSSTPSAAALDVRLDLILFLAPLSAYDETLAEDPLTNRLDDSLELLEQILESRSLANTAVVVLLNKADVLRRKVEAAARGKRGSRGVQEIWPREWRRWLETRRREGAADATSGTAVEGVSGTKLPPSTAYRLSLLFLESRFRNLVRSKHHLAPQRAVHVRTTVATSEARMREVFQFVDEAVLRRGLRGLGLT